MAGDESAEETWVDQATGWAAETATEAANWTAETATEAANWTAETATDAANWTAETATDAANWTAETATDAANWTAETVTDAANVAAETVSEDGNWWWDGSDWQPVLGGQEQAVVAQTGVAAAAEHAMAQIPEIQINRERILQDIAHDKSRLLAGLQAARTEAAELQSTFPEVDQTRLADLATTLSSLSETAAAAGFRAGDDDYFYYAQVAFYQARDDTEWASRRAVHGSQQSDQVHAALEEIPPLVEHALETVQDIVIFDAEHVPPESPPPPTPL
jgi:hypothetical protein